MPIVMADYANVPPAGTKLRATLSKIKDDVVFSSGGTGVQFSFDLADHPGWSATMLCSGIPSDKNRFGRLITTLLGRLPDPTENVDSALASCIGASYNVVVKHNEQADGTVYLNIDEIEAA